MLAGCELPSSVNPMPAAETGSVVKCVHCWHAYYRVGRKWADPSKRQYAEGVTMIISPTELALVRHLEEQLLEPEVRRSADHVGRLLADEFIEFGSSGAIYDKRGIIDALQFEEPGTTVRMVDFTARPIASDVVLVTYRSIR